MRNDNTSPKPKASKPKNQSSKPNEQALNKIEAQIKMAEMELKMIEHEINAAVEPGRLTKLAAAHAAKLKEIDELYTRWEEMQC